MKTSKWQIFLIQRDMKKSQHKNCKIQQYIKIKVLYFSHKLKIWTFTLGVERKLQYNHWKILTLNRVTFCFSTMYLLHLIHTYSLVKIYYLQKHFNHSNFLFFFFNFLPKITIAIDKHVEENK